MTKYLKLNELTLIKEFATLLSCCDKPTICSKGKFSVDGKSIMSLLSLDISDGIKVEYPDDFVELTNFIESYGEKC